MMVVSQDMPPHTGATRRWTAALQLDGQAVLTDSGGTLPKASYEDLLGWVAAGELTDIGLRAVEDGMWVDPPIEVLEAAQVLRQIVLEAAQVVESPDDEGDRRDCPPPQPVRGRVPTW